MDNETFARRFNAMMLSSKVAADPSLSDDDRELMGLIFDSHAAPLVEDRDATITARGGTGVEQTDQ
jgi:hypothetical protein